MDSLPIMMDQNANPTCNVQHKQNQTHHQHSRVNHALYLGTQVQKPKFKFCIIQNMFWYNCYDFIQKTFPHTYTSYLRPGVELTW